MNAGDAFHVSAPSPDADGGSRSMAACLKDAHLRPEEVEHINCHATSTPLGDPVEITAIYRVFGEHAREIKVTALKGATGHLLGATGAVESIVTVLSCFYGQIPPIINLEKLDPQIQKLPFKPIFVTGQIAQWPSTRRVALKNGFGFGGTNATLAFSNFER